jgi:endonuclease/exonuclease/phosphatase family metal-dependent hydrolase
VPVTRRTRQGQEASVNSALWRTTTRGMKLISWNVNGRVADACAAQINTVLERAADVLALQELTRQSYAQWCDALLAAGFSVVSTIDLVSVPYPEPSIKRKYFNAIAARGAIAPRPGLHFPDPDEARLAFPEKYVAARIVLDGLELEVHNAHVPPGSTRGVIKPQAFHAIRRRTDQVTVPHVLCGDFNTPRHEDVGHVTTWAPLGPGRAYWDAAERSVMDNPKLRDIYRERHQGSDPFPVSHYTGTTARRYDHIYASEQLHFTTCTYHQAWLEDRLSDHAAVEADLEVATERLAAA